MHWIKMTWKTTSIHMLKSSSILSLIIRLATVVYANFCSALLVAWLRMLHVFFEIPTWLVVVMACCTSNRCTILQLGRYLFLQVNLKNVAHFFRPGMSNLNYNKIFIRVSVCLCVSQKSHRWYYLFVWVEYRVCF